MSFTFDIKGIDKLEQKLREYPEKAKQAVHGVLVDYVTKINAEQVRLAGRFTDRGSLIKGIGWAAVEETNFSLFSQAPYSAYLEFGTRKKFQPIAGVDASPYRGSGGAAIGKSLFQLILEWVKRKGIVATFSTGVYKAKSGGFAYDAAKSRKKKTGKAQDKKDRQVAFAIYKSILINGIKPQPFFFTPFLSRREEIKRAVEEAINKI